MQERKSNVRYKFESHRSYNGQHLLSLRLYFTLRTRERHIAISRKGDTVLDDNSNVYFFSHKMFPLYFLLFLNFLIEAGE